MADCYLYLVRHGQQDKTTMSEDRLGTGLTARGREQAQVTAARLSRLPVRAIHCSTMRRAAQTGDIIAVALPNLEIQWSELLWEGIPCVPPDEAELFSRYPAKRLAEDRGRMERAFNQFFKTTQDDVDRYEVLISHGNLIRYLVCRAMGVSPAAWTRLDINNCGITVIKIEPNGRQVLIAHNDAGHLPAALKTFI